ncbi:MAG: hypothetical protein ACK4GO_18150 [Gemmobacter sp.]
MAPQGLPGRIDLRNPPGALTESAIVPDAAQMIDIAPVVAAPLRKPARLVRANRRAAGAEVG